MERSTAPAAAPQAHLSISPDQTRELGRRIGAAATPSTVVALIGPLGAGKTQLTKGIAEGLGVPTVVNSPTFILMNEHQGRLRLYHVDAYRLGEPEEAVEAGLIDDRQSDGVVVVEWADRLDGWLQGERLDISLAGDEPDPSVRRLRWAARGDAHRRLAAAALGPMP
jgi:tRNA threonylcarbamoyladenosine biosynthesis protein TsaE